MDTIYCIILGVLCGAILSRHIFLSLQHIKFKNMIRYLPITSMVPKSCTVVTVIEALIPIVMISNATLLVMLVNGISMVIVVISPPVATIDISRHVMVAKALFILVSFSAAHTDTLGFSLLSLTLYVRLTALMEALPLKMNRT